MNVRFTVLLVVVLLLVGGSVGITLSLRDKESKEPEPWLYKLNMVNMASISVTHKGTRTDYAVTGDFQWVIKDGNDTPVFLGKWSGKPSLLAGPRCARALVERIDDPAKYGLDEPQTRVRIVDKSGSSLEFHLGDPTPDGKNWYARLVGSDRLCTLPAVYNEVVSKMATEPPYPPTPEPEIEEGASPSPEAGS